MAVREKYRIIGAILFFYSVASFDPSIHFLTSNRFTTIMIWIGVIGLVNNKEISKQQIAYEKIKEAIITEKYKTDQFLSSRNCAQI